MDEKFNTVLCQSCGKENNDKDEFCHSCGAPLPGKLKEKQERAKKEEILAGLNPGVAKKIKNLEEDHENRPDAMALIIQLSNLYKDVKLKDYAVEYMEKAVKLEPENKFLLQKLRLLVDGGKVDASRLEKIEKSRKEVKKLSKIVYMVFGVILLIAVSFIALKIFFPSTYRVAKGDSKQEAVNPGFSSDGKQIAYIQRPKFTVFGMVDAFSGHEKGEAWLMVKPLKGKAAKLKMIGKGYYQSMDFKWRPGYNELTFASWTKSDDFLKRGVHIYSMSTKGGQARLLAKSSYEFAWSKDGQFLAFIRESWRHPDMSGLFILNTETKVERKISSLECSNPHWSPTTNELVFQGVDTGRKRAMLQEMYFAAADGGEKAYDQYADYVGDIYIYNEKTDSTSQITDDGGARSPMFTPDGNLIAYLTYPDTKNYENILVTIDKTGGDKKILLDAGKEYDYFGKFDFSVDGKTVAFEGYFVNPDAPEMPGKETPMGLMGGGKNYVCDIFTADINGANVTRLKSDKHKFKSNPVFSPDGKTLAYEVTYIDLHKEIWAMKR